MVTLIRGLIRVGRSRGGGVSSASFQLAISIRRQVTNLPYLLCAEAVSAFGFSPFQTGPFFANAGASLTGMQHLGARNANCGKAKITSRVAHELKPISGSC